MFCSCHYPRFPPLLLLLLPLLLSLLLSLRIERSPNPPLIVVGLPPCRRWSPTLIPLCRYHSSVSVGAYCCSYGAADCYNRPSSNSNNASHSRSKYDRLHQPGLRLQAGGPSGGSDMMVAVVSGGKPWLGVVAMGRATSMQREHEAMVSKRVCEWVGE